jgi:thiol:disulfide interchange protein DsbD
MLRLLLITFLVLLVPLHRAAAQGLMPQLPAASPPTTRAPERATLRAEVNYPSLPPGQQAVVALTLDIAPGLHAQAHGVPRPFIGVTIEPEPADGLTFYRVQYPPGHSIEYPALGKMSVYSGSVTFYLPLQIAPSAPAGPREIKGRLRYQACDDRTCFPPATVPFTVRIEVVPSGQPVTPSASDIFSSFDARVFRSAGVASPSPLSPSGGVDVHLLGWQFSLPYASVFLPLAIAFVIGILFNLMPCVLPVLPLKAIGFYEVSRHNRSRSLMLGGVFSLGLIAAFAVLAVLVVIYRKAWGEQFSSPWFVWTMVAILVLFALGMFGAFTVLLPARVYNLTPSHETIGGNFLFGAFTALLSTPCTAPMFVGLLAWAGHQPQWLGVAAVLWVGVGMAFPYFVLSALPELARKLPRSGPWSELVKQCMAFLILAVAAYFAAGQLVHGTRFVWAVFAVIACGAVFLVVRAFMLSQRLRPRLIAGAIAALVASGAYGFARHFSAPELISWQPYSEQVFREATQQGRVVMLEFTANWCTNCIELEARVLRNPRVAAEIERLGRLGVIAIRADLSRDDAPGWQKLQEIAPSGGIPLTVIYSPRHPPIHLSSIYTTDHLIASLARAAEYQR